MNRIKTLLMTVALVIVAGCQSFEEPGLSLASARFAEPPIIIQRADHYYLRYRRALDNGHFPLRSVLYAKKSDDAGFYFFSNPISDFEWGCLEERPLFWDEFEDFARRSRVYWLDPDGTKHQLQVRPEK